MFGKVKIGKTKSMEGVVFPPCSACGAPYRPTKPINPVTLMFESPDWVANLLFKFERFFQRLRLARMRTK